MILKTNNTNLGKNTSLYLYFSSSWLEESSQKGHGRVLLTCPPQRRTLTAGGPSAALFVITKKTVPTNQSPYEHGKGYFKALTINANCQPVRDTGWNDLYPSHNSFLQMENYIFDLLERLATKNTLCYIKHKKKKKNAAAVYSILCDKMWLIMQQWKRAEPKRDQFIKSHIIKQCHRI